MSVTILPYENAEDARALGFRYKLKNFGIQSI